MRTSRWLTLGAAIVVTVLEAWLFTGVSAVASAPAAPTATTGPDSGIEAPDPAGSNAAVPPNNDTGNGQVLYALYCAACHQANGEGVAGTFPPLKGSAVVNRADATKHIDVVLSGLQGARVSGVTYTNPMPAFAATLSDAAIASIVDYERGAWGNHGVLITPARVASERARLK